MVRVVATIHKNEIRDKSPAIADLWAFGHAAAAKKGSDIVCAGVSALIQSFSDWVGKESQNKKKQWSCTTETKEGSADIYCAARSDKKELIATFEMTVDGIESIAKAYPGYVSVERKEYP